MKRITRKAGILTAMLLGIFAVAAFAQDPVPTPTVPNPIEWEQVAAILVTGIFGIPVQGLTQVIKEAARKYLKFPDAHWVGWLASAIAIIPSAYLYLKPLGQFSWPNLLAASAIGWLVANGFYKKEIAMQKTAGTATAKAFVENENTGGRR